MSVGKRIENTPQVERNRAVMENASHTQSSSAEERQNSRKGEPATRRLFGLQIGDLPQCERKPAPFSGRVGVVVIDA